MKSRTKKPAEPEKKANGGRRPGAGRKALGDKPMSAGIYIRCTAEQKEALADFVAELSVARQANGQSKVDLSTWLRELGLKHSGNEDLGLAAKFGGIV